MKDIYLIAKFGGERIAIESKFVESVVHVQDVVATPKSDRSVAGIFALRSRVLTLIDSQYIVTGRSSDLDRNLLAVILEVAGYSYGLLVEKAEDVVSIAVESEIDTIAAAPQWQKIIKKFAVLDGKTIMIVDPYMLVAGGGLIAA